MSIQLSKADLVVNGNFCAGSEIFDQFERSSPVCLGLDFFTGRLRPNNQNRLGNHPCRELVNRLLHIQAMGKLQFFECWIAIMANNLKIKKGTG